MLPIVNHKGNDIASKKCSLTKEISKFPKWEWHGGLMAAPKKRLATLTPYEDKCWVFAFRYHRDVGKQGDAEADRRAWRDIRREFPRLMRYDGCLP